MHFRDEGTPYMVDGRTGYRKSKRRDPKAPPLAWMWWAVQGSNL